MSEFVQVFGWRHAETIPTLGQPASEKRQGTKSRGLGHRQCSGCYGDLALACVLGKLSRRWRSDRFSSNLERACWRERTDRTLLDRILRCDHGPVLLIGASWCTAGRSAGPAKPWKKSPTFQPSLRGVPTPMHAIGGTWPRFKTAA